MAENKEFKFEGNEVDLEEVLKWANSLVKEAKANKADEKMGKVKEIVEGVARKYASKWIDREDLEQDLWVSSLELINRCGGIENTDLKLIAKNAWNKAVDSYRYNRRRHDSKVRLIDESESDDGDYSAGGADQAQYFTAKSRTGYDEAILKEVVDLFPEGSRQRKYVVAKLYSYGEIDDNSGLPDELQLPENDDEASFLKLIGFNSRYPASWGKMKYEIREKIYRYLGLMPESYEDDPKKMLECIRDRVEILFSETRSGYIGLDRLAKDKVLILMGANEDRIWKAMTSSRKLLRGLTAQGGKFVMKDEPRYHKNSEKNHDVIIPREK
jgi:hypothetical protein